MTMTTKWAEFLSQQRLTEPASSGFVGLHHLGLLRFHGEDAASFLQGQVTCDVKRLAVGETTLGAVCNPKGRVVADFRLLRIGDSYCMVLAADLAESVCLRLRRYVLRAKVSVTDLTPGVGAIGLIGMDSTPTDLVLPGIAGQAEERSGILAYRLADGRCALFAEHDRAVELWTALRASSSQVTKPDRWHLCDIEAGLPSVVAATSESFLPQMLNLDALGGISFAKGCYTGQEVVTRTHFLGQVKRRMIRARGRGDELPVPGSAVYGGTEAGEPPVVGTWVTSARVSPGCWEGLMVVNVEAVKSGALFATGPTSTPLEPLELPYPLDGAAA